MSTVIKAGETGRLLRRLSTVDLVDYVQEGRAVVLEAERRAASIIEEAHRESERLSELASREGREAGHAKHTEVVRRMLGVRRELRQHVARGGEALPPRGLARHEVARREVGVLGRHDLAHGGAVHRDAERVRRRVRLDVPHAAAHVRIDREEAVADADLARGGLRHIDLDDLEAVVRGQSLEKRIANIAVGPSTVRGQPENTAAIARAYLSTIDLRRLSSGGAHLHRAIAAG